MALEDRFKRPQTFICDDGGLWDGKFNNAQSTPFEGTLKSALLARKTRENDAAGIFGKNIVSAHEKPAGLNVKKTNDKKR